MNILLKVQPIATEKWMKNEPLKTTIKNKFLAANRIALCVRQICRRGRDIAGNQTRQGVDFD
jgi:hypothetical protein